MTVREPKVWFGGFEVDGELADLVSSIDETIGAVPLAEIGDSLPWHDDAIHGKDRSDNWDYESRQSITELAAKSEITHPGALDIASTNTNFTLCFTFSPFTITSPPLYFFNISSVLFKISVCVNVQAYIEPDFRVNSSGTCA